MNSTYTEVTRTTVSALLKLASWHYDKGYEAAAMELLEHAQGLVQKLENYQAVKNAYTLGKWKDALLDALDQLQEGELD